VVHPGVPAVAVDRQAGRRRVHELTGAEQVVAVVGRLHPDKGQLDALHAVAAVPGAHLLVVGAVDTTTPGFEAELEAEAEALGVRGRVTLAGEQDDIVELLAGCDAVLVPTIVPEGFGLVAVEAMRAGTPVVAYGHGGVIEVVGDCGVLVPPGDRAALGRRLGRLLADEHAAARLGECGPRRAELFTAEATVAGMRARYRAATASVTAAIAEPHASDP
jgi:glycosyltransferase involved in cell wall biosynthesis